MYGETTTMTTRDRGMSGREINRRRLLTGMAAGGAGLALLSPSASSQGKTQDATPDPEEARYTAEVDAGLRYFQERAAAQMPLFTALLAALESDDLDTAKAAYIAARPPYEEIEVLAASFPDTDAAIDARPYSIDGGETSDDYVSIHRIEALLFRDTDLVSAIPFARGLIESGLQLVTDLERHDAFDATLHFEGMIALANEVAAKKISSEEETWSDQSLLIFDHNWQGIRSQFKPFSPTLATIDGALADDVSAAFAATFATIAPYPPARDGTYPPYSRVPAGDRGEIVRASYQLRDALTRSAETLGLR